MKRNKFALMQKLNSHTTGVRQEDVVICAPSIHKGLEDTGADDYDINAKILLARSKNPALAKTIEQGTDAEAEYAYGPQSNYKGRYRYNGDD